MSAVSGPVPPGERIHLLAADPDLGHGIPTEDRDLARRLVVAEAHTIPPGEWGPGALCGPDAPAACLVLLEGAVTREVCLADRRSAGLFGPGDILRPARPAESMLPHEVHWRATEQSSVAVLDERFVLATRRWPSLATNVTQRLLDQSERLATHVAIAQLARVDQRVLALLWHLADRWGRVTGDGVVVPIKLTHEALGRLVGAQRPTVTLALAELGASGTVTRSSTGGWLLGAASRDLLEPPRPADAAQAGVA